MGFYTKQLRRIAAGSEILKVCWNPTLTKIFGFSESRQRRAYDHQEALLTARLLEINSNSDDPQVAFECFIPVERQFGKFMGLECHENLPLLLLIWEDKVQLWNYEKWHLVAARSFGRKLRGGGFYPDEQRVWLLPEASSGSVEWAVWNFEADIYKEYSLERHYEYGRGATLHPSGELIGACWCGSSSGYYIHRDSGHRELFYYTQPSADLSGNEGYLPTFSPDGQYFACISNPFQNKGDSGTINVFEIETAKRQFAIPTNFYLAEQNLQFAEAGKTIAFSSGNDLFIHHLFPRESPSHIKAHVDIKHFAAARTTSQYALALGAGWLMLIEKSTENAKEFEDYRQQAGGVAQRFIEKNKPHLRVVREEDED